MKEKFTSLEKIIEKNLTELATKAEQGHDLTPKAAEILHSLSAAHFFNCLNKMMAEAKEHKVHSGKQPIGFHPQHASHSLPWQHAMASVASHIMPGLPIPIWEDGDSDEMEMRRGVPGTGPYGDPRKRGRRRRSPRYEYEVDAIGLDHEHDGAYADGDYEHDGDDDMEMARRSRRGRRGMQGVPSKGTPADRRLKRNRPRYEYEAMDGDMPHDEAVRHAVRSELRAAEMEKHEFDKAVQEAVKRGTHADGASHSEHDVHGRRTAHTTGVGPTTRT